RALVHRPGGPSRGHPGEVADAAPPRGAAVRERGPGLAARVVGGRGGAPEPHLPRASRPGERPALLASEGTRGAAVRRGALWGRVRRHRSGPPGVPALAGDDAAGPGAGRAAAGALAGGRAQRPPPPL